MTTIIIIIAVLLVCVFAIAIMQKREQDRAKLRQQVSRCKYRANEAAEILSNFAQLPIGAESRRIMMQYIRTNYLMARDLAPNDKQLQQNLDTIEVGLKNPPPKVDNQRLSIPPTLEQVTMLVNKLNSLAKFLMKIKSVRGVDPMLVNPAVTRLMSLISEAKICAYIMQGRESLAKHEYVAAQRIFAAAKAMLAKVADKDQRLNKLSEDLQALMKLTPQQAAEAELSISKADQSDTLGQAAEDNENDNEEVDSDDLFGPRKKW